MSTLLKAEFEYISTSTSISCMYNIIVTLYSNNNVF